MKNKKNDAPVAKTLMPEIKVEEKSTEGATTEEVKPKKSNYKKRVKKVQLAVVVSEPQEDICVCDCEPVADSPEKTNWFVKMWNKFILRRK